MVKVVTHAPPPAPPETYDLLGLTRDQMLGFHKLIGSTTGNTAYQVYQAIGNALAGHDGDHALLRKERDARFPGLEAKGEF